MLNVRNRSEIPALDCWDLTRLYPSTELWEKDFDSLKSELDKITQFQGTLANSAEALKAALNFSNAWERRAEKLGEYAHLKTAQDVTDSEANERMGRFMAVATQASASFSYMIPEIQAIDDEGWNSWIGNSLFDDERIALTKIRRFKPHVLGAEAERVLALGQEARSTAQKAFSQLTNADLDFGTLEIDGQEQALTQASYSVFLQHRDPELRRKAYLQFYTEFDAHSNTLASLYIGNIQQDVWGARSRNYPSARAKALFADKVPETVYDNLVATVRDALPTLHRYYDLKRRALKLKKLHHADVYAPMVAEAKRRTTFNEAINLVIDAVAPLGPMYQQTLKQGLTGSWVDKYENRGKRSGAFSSGCYDSEPYILMNFKEEDLRDVFTLAHEAGHSMHTWHSVRHNPFQHYGYTIFEAEVASTFNEQLLAKLLLDRATDKAERAAILGKLVEDTVATLFRQTMFAEFEHLVHIQAEAGDGLTLESVRQTYRTLLDAYFGPDVELPELASLEGLRIPHFYNAFYVYKYATGLSASLALSDRVLYGGSVEREQYLDFLKSGGSRFPLESLAIAGVDMSRPEPILNALEVFSRRLSELETLL